MLLARDTATIEETMTIISAIKNHTITIKNFHILYFLE